MPDSAPVKSVKETADDSPPPALRRGRLPRARSPRGRRALLVPLERRHPDRARTAGDGAGSDSPSASRRSGRSSGRGPASRFATSPSVSRRGSRWGRSAFPPSSRRCCKRRIADAAIRIGNTRLELPLPFEIPTTRQERRVRPARGVHHRIDQLDRPRRRADRQPRTRARRVGRFVVRRRASHGAARNGRIGQDVDPRRRCGDARAAGRSDAARVGQPARRGRADRARRRVRTAAGGARAPAPGRPTDAHRRPHQRRDGERRRRGGAAVRQPTCRSRATRVAMAPLTLRAVRRTLPGVAERPAGHHAQRDAALAAHRPRRRAARGVRQRQGHHHRNAHGRRHLQRRRDATSPRCWPAPAAAARRKSPRARFRRLGLVRTVVVFFGKPAADAPPASDAFDTLDLQFTLQNQVFRADVLALHSRDVDLVGSGTLATATKALAGRFDISLSEALSAQAGNDLRRYTREGNRVVLPATVRRHAREPARDHRRGGGAETRTPQRSRGAPQRLLDRFTTPRVTHGDGRQRYRRTSLTRDRRMRTSTAQPEDQTRRSASDSLATRSAEAVTVDEVLARAAALLV